MGVAGRKQRSGLLGGQLVRRDIASAGEEVVGLPEALRKQPPQPPSAHFAARAVPAFDGPRRILPRGFLYWSIEVQPVARRRDFAERHADLRHAERAGVHADEHDALVPAAVAPQVLLVACPGIVERVIDMGDRRGKRQAGYGMRQFLRGGNQVIGAHCISSLHISSVRHLHEPPDLRNSDTSASMISKPRRSSAVFSSADALCMMTLRSIEMALQAKFFASISETQMMFSPNASLRAFTLFTENAFS